jgi:hypothetical protein
VRAVLPDGVGTATVGNRTRQISLAAADRQHVVVHRVDAATVRVTRGGSIGARTQPASVLVTSRVVQPLSAANRGMPMADNVLTFRRG